MKICKHCKEIAALYLGDYPEIHTDARIDELAIMLEEMIVNYISDERQMSPNCSTCGEYNGHNPNCPEIG